MARDNQNRRIPTGFKAFIAPPGTSMPMPPVMTDSAWEVEGWSLIPSFTGGPAFSGEPKFKPFKPAHALGKTASDLVAAPDHVITGTIDESALESQAIGMATGLLSVGDDGIRRLSEGTKNADYPFMHLVLLGYGTDPNSDNPIPLGFFYPLVKLTSMNFPKFSSETNRTIDLKFDAYIDDEGEYIDVGTAVLRFDVPESIEYATVPDVKLLTAAAAVSALQSAGFSVISQVSSISAAVTSGYVIAQNPPSGVTRLLTAINTLTISQGAE